jgi:hypothetical protein
MHVNGADLALWQINYNPTGPQAFPYQPEDIGGAAFFIPEPVTLLGLLMGVGTAGVLRRRRA